MPAPSESARATMFHNRLRKVARHRRKWARRSSVDCYRLYDRDIPEIPLIVDWYDGRLHISDMSRDDEAIDLDALLDAASRAVDVPREQVYCKRRQRQRGAAQYTPFDRAEARFVVPEGGHRFWVNLSDYLDTGLFLDHRRTRARVQSEAAGARVLNLFAYTGSFTVYAAAGGARRTMTVDLSATYLEWAQANLELNELAGSKHQFERADVLQWMRDAREGPARYDIIVLDPPTFSNSKRMQTTFDVRRDHGRLIADARALLTRGGVLYFSTNARRFRLDDDIPAEEITDIPPDFERRRPHRCWKIPS